MTNGTTYTGIDAQNAFQEFNRNSVGKGPSKKGPPKGSQGQPSRTSIDKEKLVQGAYNMVTGGLAVAGGVAGIVATEGVASPWLAAPIMFGFTTAGLGLAQVVSAVSGKGGQVPGGVGVAVDQAVGGSGMVGATFDLISTGKPSTLLDKLVFGANLLQHPAVNQMVEGSLTGLSSPVNTVAPTDATRIVPPQVKKND